MCALSPRGTGYAKCGGNYGASFRAGKKAEEKGYSLVLWLDGVERKYIEEVGAMNVMFMVGDEIVHPRPHGSILPGVTRKSCVELLKSRGYKVSERLFSLDELKAACASGELKEAWAAAPPRSSPPSPPGHRRRDLHHQQQRNRKGHPGALRRPH
jgi:branched-chain amino acid aminotransferase